MLCRQGRVRILRGALAGWFCDPGRRPQAAFQTAVGSLLVCQETRSSRRAHRISNFTKPLKNSGINIGMATWRTRSRPTANMATPWRGRSIGLGFRRGSLRRGLNRLPNSGTLTGCLTPILYQEFRADCPKRGVVEWSREPVGCWKGCGKRRGSAVSASSTRQRLASSALGPRWRRSVQQ